MKNDGLDDERRAREAAGAWRVCRVTPAVGGAHTAAGGRRILNFCSNDYLDLARHPRVIAAARAHLEEYGAGAAASRLLAGTLPCHAALEEELAAFKGKEAALVFGSGYAANVGLISGLLQGERDVVFADRLAHASMTDGIRLSGARLRRFRHNDVEHLRALLRAEPAGMRRRLIVTESVFSMDGDWAPLAELAALAREYDAWLLVDEAHAVGVFGAGGRGRVHERGLTAQTDFVLGTLSKALGGQGGYVACTDHLRAALVNHARSFIYSTALAPAAVGAARGALAWLREQPDPGAPLRAAAAAWRAKLADAGLRIGPTQSQIVPVHAGENETALEWAGRLRARDIHAAAVRPPTVPPHTARLRLSLTLAHTAEDCARAADALIATAPEGAR